MCSIGDGVNQVEGQAEEGGLNKYFIMGITGVNISGEDIILEKGFIAPKYNDVIEVKCH
jgi:hypothetical protein